MPPLAKVMGFETLVLGTLIVMTFLMSQPVVAVVIGGGLLMTAGILKLRKKV